MVKFFHSLLSPSQLLPHGHCYLWQRELVGLHTISDALITLAYYSIALMLVYFIYRFPLSFVEKEQRLDFTWIFLMFGSFITACGTTHLIEIWTLWHPAYWLSGFIKAFTAFVSLYTAVELLWLIPKALTLPKPAELRAANQQLATEISDRKRAEAALHTLNISLEQRVIERTEALRVANQQLSTRARQQQIVAELGQRALSGCELAFLTQEAVTLVTETLQVEYCEILERLPDDGTFSLQASAGWPEAQAIRNTIRIGQNSQAGYTLLVNEPVIVPDLQTETRFTERPLLHNCGAVSGVSVPISGSSRPFAVLSIYSQTCRRFTHDDVYFLQAIANVLSTAIERQQAEQALRKSEEQFRQLAENIREVFWMTSSDQSQILYISPAFEEVWGRSRAELSQQPKAILQTVHPEDSDRLIAAAQRQARGEFTSDEYRILRPDGEVRWICTKSFPVRSESGEFYRTAGISEDITDRKLMEEALFKEKELAQVTLQSIGDGVITTDAFGCVKELNPVAETLTGWKASEAKGLPLAQVFPTIDELTGQPLEVPSATFRNPGENTCLDRTVLLMSRDGREYAIEDSVAPIATREGELLGAVLVFRDVTSTRHLTRQLSWQASHDALTGLVNRAEFERCLENCLTTAWRDHQQHVLCYLDLDRFKIVNDTCGHLAGDELLRQVSALLQTRCRKSDILARLGGDEFGLLLQQCSLENGQQVAHQLQMSIQEFRFIWHEKIFTIGVSIGVVPIGTDNVELFGSASKNRLLSAADAACYTAKNQGRNRIQVYQPHDREVVQQQGEAHWMARLTTACAENRFCLYYQTIVPLQHEATVDEHYEVLLRLLDDEGGDVIPPWAFLSAAERYNLMPKIDRWVISTFFKYLASTQWKQSKKRGFYSINISGNTVNDEEFIDFVEEQFEKYQIPPQSICFEITETVVISNFSKASTLIRALKKFGFRLALDDFGSGMSSFVYLKNLPVDYLKIDGDFVSDMENDPVDYALVKAINGTAHVMGISTIAEFVSSPTLIEQVRALGVDYAQGYAIAMPQPLIVKTAHDSSP